MLLFSDAVTSAYKDTSKALKEVDLSDKKVVKENIDSMMKQIIFPRSKQIRYKFHRINLLELRNLKE